MKTDLTNQVPDLSSRTLQSLMQGYKYVLSVLHELRCLVLKLLRCWLLMLQLMTAVKDMHDKKLMHGDLKPENVMRFEDEDTHTIMAKVIDCDGAEPVDENGIPYNK